MTYFEVFNIIKDVTLTIFGLAGTIIAYKGLTTWRKQLIGEANYNLSRNFLIALYKYRDAINRVRNPGIYSREMFLNDEEERKSVCDEKIKFDGLKRAYENRIIEVSEQRNILYTYLIEAEINWGSEIKQFFTELIKLENELRRNISNYFESTNPYETEDYRVDYRIILNSER